MPKDSFFELFIEGITDALNGEQQIVEALPKVIQSVTMPELKDALEVHLEETENQISRLQQIFSSLNLSPSSDQETNYIMESLIAKGDAIMKRKLPSMVKDAALIAACQCIEHYEIAVYGTLATYADQLELKDIADLLEETLSEESKADKKLSRIANGGFFVTGVNKLAREQ